MRVTYYGQACLLVEAAGKRILMDPWLTEGAYFGTWFHTHLLADAGVSPTTFPKDIDYIFLSHEHQDHVDPESLQHFASTIPVIICKFVTPKFREYLNHLGLTNILELPSGIEWSPSKDLKITVLGSAEYTNDSALLVEAENRRVFNETDCKLNYAQLEAIGRQGIDIGFYMFSGANWYPILYDYPEDVQRELVVRRRRSLLRSFIQRVKVTRPKIAIPAAGPCTVLDPERLWLNSEERGIFIDPEQAVEVLRGADLPAQIFSMATTDGWDSERGFEWRSPASFRQPRMEYIRSASARMAAELQARRAAEAVAGPNLGQCLVGYFDRLVGAQTPQVRKRIAAKLGLVVTGQQGSAWTVDFTTAGPAFVREGLCPDWTYKIEVEDKLLYPFVTGKMWFFEDLLLSLRARLSRRPDKYNEPLYHFLYDPDPERLHNWYAKD